MIQQLQVFCWAEDTAEGDKFRMNRRFHAGEVFVLQRRGNTTAAGIAEHAK